MADQQPVPGTAYGSYYQSTQVVPQPVVVPVPAPLPAAHSHQQGVGIPSMRPAYEQEPVSTTPIYDSLYSEFRRMFRALPGDRSGEENLHFQAFSRYPAPTEASGYDSGWPGGRHRGGAMLSLPPGRG